MAIGRMDLALARLVARVGLVDHVDAALAAHNLAVGVTLLRGFDGGDNFHKKGEHTVPAPPLSNGKPARNGFSPTSQEPKNSLNLYLISS